MAQNKDIILLDTDGTKLYPLAHKDSSKNVIDTTYLKKSGGTMTGPLVINGYAGNNPLMVRGINGSDGEGNLGDLYLNYEGGVTYFGTSGGGNISADGKSYSGNAATATKATAANNFTVTNTNPSSLTNYYPVWVTGTSANTNYAPRVNNGFWYQSSEGTASTVGESYLVVGNLTASGTAGNKRGTLALTASNSNYAYLRTDTLTGNRTLLLPDGNGTLVYTNSSNSVTSLPGNLSFANANIGVQRVGRSVSWHKGRDGALLKVTSLSGYSPTTSTKTTNGSWEIGAYDSSGYTDDLVFSYVKDSDYTNNTNNHVEIKFLENGTIVGNLSGDVTGNVTGNVTGSSSLNVLKAGDTMSGNLFFANTNNTTTTGSTPLGIYGSVGDNDGWRIVGLGGSNAGSLEIATDDDGNEPIYVRQYSGGGSSAGFVTVARTLTLLDGNGNTTIPGSLNLSSTADAAGGTAGSPPLIIGTSTGQHIEIDNNEILSKSNGTTPSILYLQDSTGGVVVAGSGGLNVSNGNLAVSGTITSTGAISATAGSIWAGTDGNTAAERDLGVQSGAGRIYLYSAAATNGARGIYLSAHGTDTSGKNVLSVDTNNNTTFYGTLSGTATNATNVGVTNKNVSTGEWFYVPWINNLTTANQAIWANNGFRYYTLEGTASAAGHSIIQVGNSTATGTAGNKTGRIRLFTSSSGYVDIYSTGNTSNRSIYIPALPANADFQTTTTLMSEKLKGGNTKSLSMSGYRRIRIYALTWGYQHVFEMNISDDNGKAVADEGLYDSSYPYQTGSMIAVRDGAGNTGSITFYQVMCKVNSAKTTFWVNAMGYTRPGNSTYNDRNNYDQYYVYRVEGIM